MPVIYGCHLPKTLCNNHCVSALPTWRTMNKDAKWKAMPTGHLLHLPAKSETAPHLPADKYDHHLYDKLLDSFFSALSPYYNPVQYIAPARPNSTPAHWDGSPPIATYPLSRLRRCAKNNREALFENCNFPCSLITHPSEKPDCHVPQLLLPVLPAVTATSSWLYNKNLSVHNIRKPSLLHLHQKLPV